MSNRELKYHTGIVICVFIISSLLKAPEVQSDDIYHPTCLMTPPVDIARDAKDQYSDVTCNLCWLTILCAGLQLTGPVYIPVGMCVGVHARYVRVPHSAPSCPHRTLGGRLRLTSSCTFPPEILLLAVVGPASAFTTSHSNLTPALPSHPAEITLCIYSPFSCIVFVLHLVLCPLSRGLIQSKSSLKLFSPVSCVQ